MKKLTYYFYLKQNKTTLLSEKISKEKAFSVKKEINEKKMNDVFSVELMYGIEHQSIDYVFGDMYFDKTTNEYYMIAAKIYHPNGLTYITHETCNRLISYGFIKFNAEKFRKIIQFKNNELLKSFNYSKQHYLFEYKTLNHFFEIKENLSFLGNIVNDSGYIFNLMVEKNHLSEKENKLFNKTSRFIKQYHKNLTMEEKGEFYFFDDISITNLVNEDKKELVKDFNCNVSVQFASLSKNDEFITSDMYLNSIYSKDKNYYFIHLNDEFKVDISFYMNEFIEIKEKLDQRTFYRHARFLEEFNIVLDEKYEDFLLYFI